MSIAAYLSNLLNSSGLVPVNKLNISGTPTGAKFLRDDASWQTINLITSGTTVASTSGTSIDFTSIPSGVKRITCMFNGVSTNGTSNLLIQVGSGSITSTGYASQAVQTAASNTNSAATNGFLVTGAMAATLSMSGIMHLCLIGSNIWVESGIVSNSAVSNIDYGSGVSPSLSGALDRIRFTTVNGTDTFDAGSINIMYE